MRSCLILRSLFKSRLLLAELLFLPSLPAYPAGQPVQEMKDAEAHLFILAFDTDVPVDALFLLGHFAAFLPGFFLSVTGLCAGSGFSSMVSGVISIPASAS